MAQPDGEVEREQYLLDEGDRLLVREVLALTPAERLDTLRVVDAFFAAARLVDEPPSSATTATVRSHHD